MADKNVWRSYQTKLLGGGLLIAGVILIAVLLSRHEPMAVGQKQIEIAIQPQAQTTSTSLTSDTPQPQQLPPPPPSTNDATPIAATNPITTIEVAKVNSKTNTSPPIFTPTKAPLVHETTTSSVPPATPTTIGQATVAPSNPVVKSYQSATQPNTIQHIPAKSAANVVKPIAATPATNLSQTKTLDVKSPMRKSGAARPVASSQTSAVSKASKSSPYTAAEKKLLAVPKQHYAIQLGGASSTKHFATLINRNGLKNKATYFQTYNNGKVWYVIVYGNFKTHTEAQIALKQLPAPLQAQHPWIRSYASIHTAIQSKLS